MCCRRLQRGRAGDPGRRVATPARPTTTRSPACSARNARCASPRWRRRASSPSCSEAEHGNLRFPHSAKKNTASVAKDRLRIIDRSRSAALRGAPDYLPLLQRELLEVIRKYVNVDVDAVKVDLIKDGDHEVLDISVALPEKAAPAERRRSREGGMPRRFATADARRRFDGRRARVLTLADIGFDAPPPCSPATACRWCTSPTANRSPAATGANCEAGLIGSDRLRARRHAGAFAAARSLPPDRAAAGAPRAACTPTPPTRSPEEDATCCLQILLADALPGVGRERLMADMDAWGYTFRLGSDARLVRAATPRTPGPSCGTRLSMPRACLPDRVKPRAGAIAGIASPGGDCRCWQDTRALAARHLRRRQARTSLAASSAPAPPEISREATPRPARARHRRPLGLTACKPRADAAASTAPRPPRAPPPDERNRRPVHRARQQGDARRLRRDHLGAVAVRRPTSTTTRSCVAAKANERCAAPSSTTASSSRKPLRRHSRCRRRPRARSSCCKPGHRVPPPNDPAQLAELTEIATRMERRLRRRQVLPGRRTTPTTCKDIGEIEDVLRRRAEPQLRRAARRLAGLAHHRGADAQGLHALRRAGATKARATWASPTPASCGAPATT